VSYTSFRLIGRRSLNREASDIGTSFVSAAKQHASTPRRKNELHFDDRSRSERLPRHGPLERLGEGAVEML
jgi:hypothetical protein